MLNQDCHEESFDVGCSSCLHILLLSSFVLVFFWMRISKSYTTSSQLGAMNTSSLLTSALNQLCQAGGSKVDNTPQIHYALTKYLDGVGSKCESAAHTSNQTLRYITYGITVLLLIFFIWVARRAKDVMNGKKWALLCAYNFVVFVLFCGFEVGFYLWIIRNYQPMCQAEHAQLYIDNIQRQVNLLRHGQTISPPAGVEGMPDFPDEGITLLRTCIERMDPNSPLIAYVAAQ